MRLNERDACTSVWALRQAENRAMRLWIMYAGDQFTLKVNADRRDRTAGNQERRVPQDLAADWTPTPVGSEHLRGIGYMV